MKIKTYSCAYANAWYSAGKYRIHFSYRCVSGQGSAYTSFNEKEQEAIESLKDFGKIIVLESVQKVGTNEPDGKTDSNTETVKEEESGEKEVFSDVVSVQDAITVIKRICIEKGVDYTPIRSRADTLAKAGELGISFPNMK